MAELDLEKGLALKAEGIERVSRRNRAWLDAMRTEAARLAEGSGLVHADMLREFSETIPEPTHQNAWGGIFRCKKFEFTGQRILSALPSNHAREIKVWQLR